MPRVAALLALLPVTACAHGGTAPPAPTPLAEPPNARARLYGDCLAAAGRAGSYDRYGRYLRLTCVGEPAAALFEAMGTFARARGHVATLDGVETRGLTSTTSNDRCWRREAQTSCLIVVPVGAFLDPAEDVPPAKEKARS